MLACFLLFGGGIFLVVCSGRTPNRAAISVSRSFLGAPTDHTICLVAIGGVAAVLGAGGLFVRSRNT
jgi:hypothetical protein